MKLVKRFLYLLAKVGDSNNNNININNCHDRKVEED